MTRKKIQDALAVCERIPEKVDDWGPYEAEYLSLTRDPKVGYEALLRAYDEAMRLLQDTEHELCDIRQLIGGWKTTTPQEEWSEWDEAVTVSAQTIHGALHKITRAYFVTGGAPAQEKEKAPA